MSQVITVVEPVKSASPITVSPRPAVSPSLVTEAGRIGPKGDKGEKGEKGETGARGAPGAAIMVKPASFPISGNRLVRLSDNSELAYATNAGSAVQARVVGLTLNAAITGDPVEILMDGDISEPSWNWDMSKLIYLGQDGYLTQVSPQAPDAAYSVVVGFPISSTSMFLNIGYLIQLT